jgi:Fe-S-cluster containining protein
VIESIYRQYEELLADVESEFDRVSKIFSDRMQCRKGCGSCCSQIFHISLIEAAYISRAVKALDPASRREMRGKARDYLADLTGAAVDEDQDIESHSRMVRASVDAKAGRHHIPCPALKDEACTIYSHRPIIARKYGIPLWNPRNPRVLQACELNFRAGEAIEAEGLVEPQMELEYRWLALKQEVLSELDLPDLVATVASAVLFDYEAIVEDRVARKTGG